MVLELFTSSSEFEEEDAILPEPNTGVPQDTDAPPTDLYKRHTRSGRTPRVLAELSAPRGYSLAPATPLPPPPAFEPPLVPTSTRDLILSGADKDLSSLLPSLPTPEPHWGVDYGPLILPLKSTSPTTSLVFSQVLSRVLALHEGHLLSLPQQMKKAERIYFTDCRASSLIQMDPRLHLPPSAFFLRQMHSKSESLE